MRLTRYCMLSTTHTGTGTGEDSARAKASVEARNDSARTEANAWWSGSGRVKRRVHTRWGATESEMLTRPAGREVRTRETHGPRLGLAQRAAR